MLKKFLSPLRQKTTKKFYIIALGSALFGSFYEVFSVIILEKIAFYIEKSDQANIISWIKIFFLSTIIYFIYRIIYKRFNIILVGRLAVYLDSIYLKKFLTMDNNEVEKIGTGRMISIMKNGLMTWADLLRKISAEYLRTILAIIIALGYIFSKGWEFIIFSLLVIIVSIIRITLFSGKSIPWRKKAKANNVEFDRLLVRWIMSKFEILQSNQYKKETYRSKEINEERTRLKIKEKIWQGITYDGMIFITTIITGILIIYIIRGINEGFFDFSTFILFSSISVLISQKMSAIADMAKDISDNFIHVTKLREKIDEGKQLQNHLRGKEFIYKQGDIKIENISFSYNDQKVFENFSISLQGGTKTAFVGESGGGKSTLIKLISGYLSTHIGNIFIDEQKLSDTKLMSYYKHIGYLTQEPSIFDGTIYENLTYSLGEDELNNEELNKKIQEIIILAKCEFIYDFEEGINTEIGEKGIRLSGGQRQRLAIAKIMLKNPQIILLDEPTSALDSFNEELVTKALYNLFLGKTVIIIAHRLQTVKHADRIIYLEGGKIIEDGTHDILITKNGKYKKMLDLQSGF